jgi:hypothetical protein
MLKIISGGQTGVDRGALNAALEAGVDCGGWCPAARQAEDGAIPARYPVRELPHGSYPDRTAANVGEADATLIIYFGALRGGTATTARLCDEMGKPQLLLDAAAMPPHDGAASACAFVQEHNVRVLNVAGARGSEAAGAHDYARAIVRELLGRLGGQTSGAV